MHIVIISTPIGFLGSGKGGGVELTINSLVNGLLAVGHKVDVVAPKNSKLLEASKKFPLLRTTEYHTVDDVRYSDKKLIEKWSSGKGDITVYIFFKKSHSYKKYFFL